MTGNYRQRAFTWRAANGTDPHDRRPTGPRQLQTAPALWQQLLDRSIAQSIHDLEPRMSTKATMPEPS